MMSALFDRRGFLKAVGLGAAAFVTARPGICEDRPRRRPNIIIILADDLGYGDTSEYGGWVKTPHIERMALEGMKFTDFHSNGAVCSPTRAGLMTGRYQQRVGIEDVIVGTRDSNGLDPKELTVPRLMKDAGYKTALYGKWHLGHLGKFNPIHHGFDEFVGYLTGAEDYHYHGNSWYNGLEKKDLEGYTTHIITDHSVRFIEENRYQPFFLYVAHEAVHLPFQTPDDPPYAGPNGKAPHRSEEYWKYWTAERIRPKYEVMLRELDKGIGQILDSVKRCGLAENTFVFFFSDNGAIGAGSNKPFRGGKASLFEGGHRVPAIAWWPGSIPAGKVTDELAIGMDLLATVAALAKIDLPKDRKLDGISLKDVLLKQAPLPDRHCFWGYGKRGTAMREKNWKFITSNKGQDLYDLNADPGEQQNLAGKHPERVEAMQQAVTQWLKEITPA
ncbi:MAG TPA: sulfatase-like hydrolase/transferase [Sedimentisphaerales bacterium]|nr:sulfatase-like hydrolase/transferase [Sedimentisphaerales bacterium]